MLNWLYPLSEQGLFVGRQDLLAQLAAAVGSLRQGRPLHLALFSPRRRGKSILLKEHFARLRRNHDVAAAYLNLEPMASTARLFATQYVGWLTYWLFAPDDAWPDDYLTWSGLRQAEVPDAVRRLLLKVSSHFDSPATPPAQLLELAFRFPERLASLVDRPLVVILDEFQSLRQLDGRRRLGQTLALFRPVLTSSRVSYTLAGSHVSSMRWIIEDADSPLFGQVTQLAPLGPLGREDARELVHRLLPNAGFDVQHRVAELAGDHPYYVQCVCDRLRLWGDTQPLEPALADAAFYAELSQPQGSIQLHCEYLVDVSLERARYHAVLRGLLDALASSGPQTISALRHGAFAGHEANALRNYLLELVAHGLVERADEGGEHVYGIVDSVLARWVNLQRLGIESADLIASVPTGATLQQLRDRLQRVSSELGTAMEAEVRETIRLLAGRELSGELFGVEGAVRLPDFTSVGGYISPDGQTELDVLAQGEETWAAEVRWQVGAASEQALREFVAKRADRAIHRHWFISRGGFRPNAVAFARANAVYLTDGAAYRRLRGLAHPW